MARFDILGIGNAIVDMVSPVDHAFLSKHDMHPGAMALIDEAQAVALTAAMPPGQQSGGGSAANTCVVAASLGATVAYLGKVADDPLGETFRTDIAAMNPSLGAAVPFAAHDVDAALVADAAVTYLEGYLFDPLAAQTAFRRAASTARAAQRRVALSLSDAFCVDRHRAAFRSLLPHVDLLFANEAEICSLYEVNRFDDAADAVAGDVGLAALTRSEAGSLVIAGAERVAVAAEPTRLVDSTGAGDAYAAGFLFGYTRGLDLAECGRIGSVAASEVISHYGARPLADLRALAGL